MNIFEIPHAKVLLECSYQLIYPLTVGFWYTDLSTPLPALKNTINTVFLCLHKKQHQTKENQKYVYFVILFIFYYVYYVYFYYVYYVYLLLCLLCYYFLFCGLSLCLHCLFWFPDIDVWQTQILCIFRIIPHGIYLLSSFCKL